MAYAEIGPSFGETKERRAWGQWVVGIRREGAKGSSSVFFFFFGIPVGLANYIIKTKYNLKKRCLFSLVLTRMPLIWGGILTGKNPNSLLFGSFALILPSLELSSCPVLFFFF